jgi:peptide deformylase
MNQKFVAPNDPILNKIAQPVSLDEINHDETKQHIEAMLDVAYGNRLDRTKPTVVGLAAPQIGISKRIIAVDIGADGKGGLANLKLYINPEITYQSDDTSDWYEGCWSTDRVCGIVSRSNEIKIKAYTPEGKEIEETHKGYVARIFQHEIDHLNGKEFITHITDDSKLHWVEENEFSDYRNNEGWRNWPKKCPREKWEKIKGSDYR